MEPYPKAYLYKRIVQAKLFMDDHFTEHIDLAAICWEASFSKFHFTRLFREVYGVGFESIPTFSNAFRKQVGKTPAAYRKAREERLQSMKEEPMDHIPNCYAVWLGWQIEDRNPE